MRNLREMSCIYCIEFLRRLLSRFLGFWGCFRRNGGFLAFLFTWSRKPFVKLDRQHRERILQGWSNSWSPISRKLFFTFKKILLISYLKSPPHHIGYPEHSTLRQKQRPEIHQFSFHNPEAEEVIEVDVVIVGSGAGGGVVAARLAQAGIKVLIVEKGEAVPTEDFPVEQMEHNRVYDGAAGAFVTADGKGTILAGSSWGGSTVVNWSGSLELPEETRNEWATTHGLTFANTPAFQSCFDHVKSLIGVSTTSIIHNTANSVLSEGSKLTNYHSFDIPQNSRSEHHGICGASCMYGCSTLTKQSSSVTTLSTASKSGALCLPNCTVTRILLSNNKATGVHCILKSGKPITIKAETIVLSSGAIRTPCLLTSSSISHPAIGKNLHVHPCGFIVGFKSSSPTKAWEGSIMTSMVKIPPKINNSPFYAKLINVPVIPGITGYQLPWRSGLQYKSSLLRLRKSIWTCVITRDQGAGEVTTKTGDPIITYKLDKKDHGNILEGIVAGCRVQIAGGCDEIQPILELGEVQMESYIPDMSMTVEERLADPRLERYIQLVRRTAENKRIGNWSSAHPQGTCRMGADSKKYPVDLEGRVRGYEGLYVADASLCPSATGVNPMLTTMALCEHVARCLERKLK
ncbi:hypothetical protein BZA77DRAFT_129814 [Pyronema omphalodes]|nr:hypothetical protein BZA77DRAFT_129814 [Pyronema omphalodes]